MTQIIFAAKRLLAKIVPEASREEIDAILAICAEDLEYRAFSQKQDMPSFAVENAEFLIGEADDDELVDIAFGEFTLAESERLRAEFLDLLKSYRGGCLSPYGNISWRSQ